MKCTCEKGLLQSAIGISSKATLAKSAVPALEGLLLEAEAALQISGYDLKTGIRTSVPAEIVETGKIVLNARLFGEIVRRLPDDVVTITADEHYSVTIECGMSVFNIMGSAAVDYPELPAVEDESSFYIPQGVLKSMIATTVFAVSDNESRPIYTGSLFEIENGELTMVSVDGYRLALRRESLEKADMDSCSFVVPGGALGEVEKIAADSEDMLKITLGSKHILFTIGDTILITRRLEGEFLNYRQSIPQDSLYCVEADRKSVIASVDRVSLIISEKLKGPIRCQFGEGVLKVSSATALGKACDECAITGDGGNVEIGFNNRFLLEALKAAPAEEVQMKFSTSVSPCVITPADDTNSFLYLVCAVRLSN